MQYRAKSSRVGALDDFGTEVNDSKAYILFWLTPSMDRKIKLAIIDLPAVADEMGHGALCHTHVNIMAKPLQ